MGAGGFVRELRRKPSSMSHYCGGRRTLAVYNTCSCHPRQWGLKKGRRRARRRLDKVIIQEEMENEGNGIQT